MKRMIDLHRTISPWIWRGMFVVLVLGMTSCATPPMISPSVRSGPVTLPLGLSPIPGPRHDMAHMVVPGETVFRLSRMYDVTVNDILLRNHFKEPADLKMGQTVMIPLAAPLREVIPVFPSRKWKYIIIHHSATDADNAMSLFKAHLHRGFDGTGYDFIVDNGTKGSIAGHVDATPRWVAQKDGAHCKASGMNAKAIGICLVGNFSQEHVPEAQLAALIRLVDHLKQYYHIPERNILGHGQVFGARTECPGTLFPWKTFKRRLGHI